MPPPCCYRASDTGQRPGFVIPSRHGRLADILLCLSHRIFLSDSFDLPLSRADLGDLTGMSTESVIRIMKEFKDDGLIDMHGKQIHLLDIGRLERISEFG